MPGPYKQSPGEINRVATVNQYADILMGLADAGPIVLFPPLSAPGALTATAATGTTLGIGTYRYKVTFLSGAVKGDGTLNIIGETDGGTAAVVTTSAGNRNVSLTSIPTGPTGTIGRRIYRTAVGGADGTQKLVLTISDNTTTSWTDTTADASLGVAVPTTNTTGTILVIAPFGSLPASGSSGAIIRLSTDGRLYMWNGAAWIAGGAADGSVVTNLVADQLDGYHLRYNSTTGVFEFSSNGSTWTQSGLPAAKVRAIARRN